MQPLRFANKPPLGPVHTKQKTKRRYYLLFI